MVQVYRAVVLAGVLVVAACAPRSAVEPGAAVPQEPGSVPHEAGVAALQGTGFTAADVRFMQHMIAHHAQALVMAAMAPTHGAGTQILLLAEKIDISQRDEIAMMRQWLGDRKQPVPEGHQGHALHMPGMLTPEQLARLDAARGRDFERLFLTFMIRHHEGALHMVDELFASPGAAQDPDIFRFVTDVAADQLDEIGVMEYMLEVLEANRGSELR